jgi:hypothetical protein
MNTLITLMIIFLVIEILLIIVMVYVVKKFLHFKGHVELRFGHYEQSILDYWKKVIAVEKWVFGDNPKKFPSERLKAESP